MANLASGLGEDRMMKHHTALNTSSYPTASCHDPSAPYQERSSSTTPRRRIARCLVSRLGITTVQKGRQTYVIRGSNCYAILEWMPAHMQDLLVEVDLIRIGLLPHSPPLPTRSSSRTSSP